MVPLPHFFRATRDSQKVWKRKGVSELYASLLMIGITLSFGSAIAALSMGQLDQAGASAAVGASLQERASSTQVSLVYASVSSPGTCPSYRGVAEGTALVLTLFDYGTLPFKPTLVVVNGTVYSLDNATLQSGGMFTYTLPISPSGLCVHPSGQSVLVANPYGDEVQFES